MEEIKYTELPEEYTSTDGETIKYLQSRLRALNFELETQKITHNNDLDSNIATDETLVRLTEEIKRLRAYEKPEAELDEVTALNAKVRVLEERYNNREAEYAEKTKQKIHNDEALAGFIDACHRLSKQTTYFYNENVNLQLQKRDLTSKLIELGYEFDDDGKLIDKKIDDGMDLIEDSEDGIQVDIEEMINGD